MNKIWRGQELEGCIEQQIRELLQSPQLAADIAASRPKVEPVNRNADIERRIHGIDRQINKLMELYQQDEIPPELLGSKINSLYAEKTALQSAIVPEVKDEAMPFDLAQELIADAAQIWDFADEGQKRRIIQSLVSKIILTEDNVKIEWAF